MTLPPLIRLLRPLQWVKNSFVFAPLFFAGHFFVGGLLWRNVLVFAAFCLAASSVYCLNDVADVEADRQHPRKRRRPVASGEVSRRAALSVMLLCMTGSMALAAAAGWAAVGCLSLYLVMNIAYCLKLKTVAIVDVFIVATGFVLRVLCGGWATGTWISEWLVLMTFLLTLLMALAKRHDDFRIYEQTGQEPRKSITGYNPAFIREAVAIVAAVTMVCYIMYTLSPAVTTRMGTRHLYLTAVFVLAALMRYLQNMTVFGRSGSPTKTLLKDRFLQLCIAMWIAAFAAIIYL